VHGEARVPTARGKKIFLCPHQQKLQSLKWKNRHESAEKAKSKHLLCVTSVIFRSNKVRSMLETHSTKATAIGESNNAGGLGAEPSVARGQQMFGGGSPDVLAILQLFSKNTHF